MNIREAIANRKMSRYQVLTVGLCVLINFLDGFDVLVMAFAAAPVAAEWNLSNRTLGLLLSAGLVGMALGSLLLAPLADRWGRRTITLLGLTIITLGMIASAFAQGVAQLAALRVLTGLGIGALLASMTVLVSEYSSSRWRSFAISLLQTGYPIGATLGGLVAVYLITHFGWRSVFLFGGLCSAVILPLIWWQLPESIDFLVTRRPKGALARLNRVLERIGLQRVKVMPDAPREESGNSPGLTALFVPRFRRATLAIWVSFFMIMFSFYFVLSWTPKMLVESGLSAQQGISGGVILNVGGIAGSLLLGYLAGRFRLVSLNMFYLAASAVFMVALGAATGMLGIALMLALTLGFFLFGAMIGIYAVTPATYPAKIRGTGMGFAIGIGRIGAILSPLVAGVVVDIGLGPTMLYAVFAAPLLVAVVAQAMLPGKPAPPPVN